MQTTVTHDISAPPWRVLLTTLLLTAAGDYLFWPGPPGVSLSLFTFTAGAALACNRPRSASTPPTLVASALLAASAVQSSVEISFSNVLVLALLGLVLAGETSYPALSSHWARWSEAVVAFAKAPLRWRWVREVVRQVPLGSSDLYPSLRLFGSVVLPAALLGVLFAGLLSAGNAIFGKFLRESWHGLWSGLPEFSIGRIFLWILVSTFALALLHPAAASGSPRWRTLALPVAREPRNPRVARWRSLCIVGLLNAIFLAANTIDALYLWIHQQVPAGLRYSDYVHQGVHSLVAAVLLSAVVLVALHRQRPSVTHSPWLTTLSLLWILQNVALLASVLLRLKLYVDAYQLSELRVHAGCFLLLVAAGFGLLAVYIWQRRTLRWLVLANAVATFTLFFVLQFLDVARWVGEYNVGRWERDRNRTLDVVYLGHLGPSAYPSLIKVAQTADRPEAHEAFLLVSELKNKEQQRWADLDWRSWQLRPIRNSRLLIEHQVRTARP